MTPEQLAAAGVKPKAQVQAEGHARILVLSAPKCGKTTALVGTAPRPLHVNCDGKSASLGAMAVYPGQDFLEYDCFTTVRKSLKALPKVAGELVKAGDVQSIILDSITLLHEKLGNEISVTLQNYDYWDALADELNGAVEALCRLPAHLFITGHLVAQKEDAAVGTLPYVQGRSKAIIPASINDWVRLDLDMATGKRQFVLGPQKDWSHSGRNIKKSCVTDATVPAMFAELGLKVTP